MSEQVKDPFLTRLLKWLFIGIIGVLGLGVLAVVIGAFSDYGRRPSAHDIAAVDGGGASQHNDSPARQAEVVEVFRTTAAQLHADYEANEVAADERMKGKLVEVSGRVMSIEKDFTDAIVVQLRTDNQFIGARMRMDDSQKSVAMNLQKGAQVTVVCKRMARIIGTPAGSACTFKR